MVACESRLCRPDILAAGCGIWVQAREKKSKWLVYLSLPCVECGITGVRQLYLRLGILKTRHLRKRKKGSGDLSKG